MFPFISAKLVKSERWFVITAASFTPVKVAVIVCEAVPSMEYTVSVSVAVEPEANACTSELVLSTVYVHAPVVALKVNAP